MSLSVHHLLIFVCCLFAALLLGICVATGSYGALIFLAAGIVLVAAVLPPGYAFLIAFGLLCPVSLPLPIVWGFPMYGVMLGLAVLKYILRKPLVENGSSNKVLGAFNVPMSLFMAWILLRYLIDPVGPGMAVGLSEGVTGFRSYLNYLFCFTLVMILGRTFCSRDKLQKLVKWLAIVAISFCVVLCPLVFTKSFDVAMFLSKLSMYVTTFDNGFLRFVIVSELGLLLVILSLMPRLLPMKRYWRLAMLMIGGVAVVLGGNRSSFAAAVLVCCAVPLLRKQYARFVSLIAAAMLAFVPLYYMGEAMAGRDDFGFLRFMSVISTRVADSTSASGTFEWRKQRWTRAWEEIQKRPLLGRGYGGLEQAFVWNTPGAEYEEEMQEIDLATGAGVHNGFLACAMAFGIPAAIFFIGLLIHQIVSNGRRAREFMASDPVMSDFHTFVFAGLLGITVWALIGADLNAPLIWFYLGFGVLLVRVRKSEMATAKKVQLKAQQLEQLVPQQIQSPA